MNLSKCDLTQRGEKGVEEQDRVGFLQKKNCFWKCTQASMEIKKYSTEE